jgi:hypothetical protein
METLVKFVTSIFGGAAVAVVGWGAKMLATPSLSGRNPLRNIRLGLRLANCGLLGVTGLNLFQFRSFNGGSPFAGKLRQSRASSFVHHCFTPLATVGKASRAPGRALDPSRSFAAIRRDGQIG